MLILTVLQGPDKGRRFELPDNEPQMIGRSSESLPLSDNTISRRHCELTPDDGRWYLRDLASANGTFVNGLRVTDRRKLEAGDQIRAGNTLLVFGRERATARDQGVRVVRSSEISSVVEHTVPSADDSMILAVPEPSEAAVVQLTVIYELTQLVGTVTDQQTLLEKIMDVIFGHFRADRGFILLRQSQSTALPSPVVVRHRIKPQDKESANITVSRTIVQHVLRKREGVLTSNAMTDARFSAGDSVRGYGIRSAICVPIRYKDEIFGVIHLDSKIANYTFTEDQLRLLTAIGVQTGLAIANVKLYGEQLRRERLAAVGQTVASLSHSIKNILQGLRGGADVVELGILKGNIELIRNGWAIVSRNLDRIIGLTMNMLAFSKQRTPEIELTNLHKLLNEVMELTQRQFDSRHIALITEIDEHLPPVPMDPSGMHQALLNLVNNALEAVEPHKGAVTIRAAYEPDRQTVEIEVSDNGVGISDVDREHLFEPFYSTKGLKGTGLGLVVTKKIVEEHGGTIKVESTPREGSTFLITLPLTASRMVGAGDTAFPE